DELLDAGELDDLVELGGDLLAGHAEDRAVEVDVLTAGEVGVETGADLDQRAEAAVDLVGAALGAKDAAEELERRALARAVGPDDAERLAALERERHVLNGPKLL